MPVFKFKEVNKKCHNNKKDPANPSISFNLQKVLHHWLLSKKFQVELYLKKFFRNQNEKLFLLFCAYKFLAFLRSCQKRSKKEIKTHFARKQGKNGEIIMKSNLEGRRRRRSKQGKNEEWKAKKSLLLHYDKHENNFPPIFSIKIIAFSLSSSKSRGFSSLLCYWRCCCCCRWRAWNWNQLKASRLSNEFRISNGWSSLQKQVNPWNIRFIIEFL